MRPGNGRFNRQTRRPFQFVCWPGAQVASETAAARPAWARLNFSIQQRDLE